MKKQFLSFALVATMIASVAAGCSSANETSGSDSATVDSSSKMAPASNDTTMKKDSGMVAPKDTTVKPKM